MPIDDHDLALRAAGGDSQAFTLLAEQYRRFIYAVAWRVVPHEEDALDITQEALARLARNIGQYRGEGAFPSWLATLTTRVALDYATRSSRREQPADPSDLADLADARATGAPPPNVRDRLFQQERRALVDAAMRRLAPQQRAILALRLNEDLDSAEVATRLGLSPAQVRSQLARAVARLRGWLVGADES